MVNGQWSVGMDRIALATNEADSDDLLWRHLKSVPAFRGVLRAVEARFYRILTARGDLQEPVLDIGCGDGHFVTMAFDEPLAAGIDPWWGPLRKAQKAESHRILVQGMGDRMPFDDSQFATIMSNSVLEHIPDVQAVLHDANRVLQTGGNFIFTTPSHLFTEYLGGAAFLERLGLNGLAERYRHFFNFISRHQHTDSAEVWAERLAQAGFVVEQWQYYFSKEALRALEWGHVQGLPSAIMHVLTGHWILGPWPGSLQWTERWLRPFYDEPPLEAGAYILIIARKVSDTPLQARLPLAQPLGAGEIGGQGDRETGGQGDRETWGQGDRETWGQGDRETWGQGDMETGGQGDRETWGQGDRETWGQGDRETWGQGDRETWGQGDRETWGQGDRENAQAEHSPSLPLSKSPPLPLSPLIPIALLLGSLFFAAVGQAVLSGNPPEAWSGLRWYGVSLGLLLLLAWQMKQVALPRLALPDFSRVGQRPWLIMISLLLSVIAQRQVGNPAGSARPLVAFVLWGTAAVLALYAFWQGDVRQAGQSWYQRVTGTAVARSTLVAVAIPLLLFIFALFLRLVNLTGHPFVLNGSEASLGLDAQAILNGELRNPFATAWLTNPTLPLYLIAMSLQTWGTTVLALRLPSAVAGALTVPAIYLIGARLWRREVGLIAAILLAGSHWHIHYSRLGLTNVWDPLLALLALGLLAMAWQQRQPSAEESSHSPRPLWLLAGVVVGLNAYLYTSSHLLPLILAGLLVWLFLFERAGLAERRSHLLAATAVALIIALPQILYYYNNPGLFMARVEQLGVFHNGWLVQEAARSGVAVTDLFGEQARQAALAFNYSLDRSNAYNPGVPLLSFWPAVFFILGLGLALARLRQLRYALLLIWLVVTLVFAGALLESPPNSHRLLIAIPAVMLLAAVAFSWIVRRLLQQLQVQPAYVLPLLALLAGLALASDIGFYFGSYRSQHRFADRNTEIAYEMSRYLNGLEGDWTTYFYGAPAMYTDFPTLSFLAPAFRRNANLFDISEPAAALPATATGPLLFIYVPERAGEMQAAEEQYPHGRRQTFAGAHANPLFYSYEVEALDN
jgi:4-amino-4-deoxy-L-arabinose transferase-like glycosyltransferase/SAM-dependent methyltransferase